MSNDFEALSEFDQTELIKAHIAQLIEVSDGEARDTGRQKALTYRAFRKHCSSQLNFDFSSSGLWKSKVKGCVQDRVKAHEASEHDGSIFEEARRVIEKSNYGQRSEGGSGAQAGFTRSAQQPPPLGFQQIRSPSIFGTGGMHPPQLRSPTHSPPRMGFAASPALSNHPANKGGVAGHQRSDLTPANGLLDGSRARAQGWDSHTVHNAYVNTCAIHASSFRFWQDVLVGGWIACHCSLLLVLQDHLLWQQCCCDCYD